ncbi:MAG: hypothetical protein GZ087_12875 [Flavobacterium sp.]|nr:hypothetical protein [Flavobacterium sp.]
MLWQEYVLIKLKNESNKRDDIHVYGQRSKGFWQGIKLRPDIVIEKGKETYVIDTKWKSIKYSKPSTHDLRQVHVYNDYWKSFKVALFDRNQWHGHSEIPILQKIKLKLYINYEKAFFL